MYIFSNLNKVYKMARYAYTNVSLYINIARELGINVDSLTDEELWEAIPYVEKARYVKNTFSLGISKLLLNEKRIQEVYLKIYDYSPKWMMLQPSVALILCMAKEKYDLPKIVTVVLEDNFKEKDVSIKSLDENITTILITDSGDIWYQDSISRIFELSENAISCVQEDRVMGEDEWMGKCINNIPAKYKTEFLHVTGGSRVKNSGVICGNRNIIIPMFKRIYMDMTIIKRYIRLDSKRYEELESKCIKMVNTARALNLMVVKNIIGKSDDKKVLSELEKLYNAEKEFYYLNYFL